jgi:acyl transferase domain-containing protein
MGVNSFGFGGTNSHLILDDAFHYLKSLGLDGNHNCSVPELLDTQMNGHTDRDIPRLFAWSAADENGLKRLTKVYEQYYNDRVVGSQKSLDKLAFTLAARRSKLAWRAYAVLDPTQPIDSSTSSPITKPTRLSTERGLAYVFTGQGAQYAKMGLELLQYPVFDAALHEASEIFRDLGCKWSVQGK